MPKLLMSEDQQTFEGICFLAMNDESTEIAPLMLSAKETLDEKQIEIVMQSLRQQTGVNIISKPCVISLTQPIPME